ncbi:NACHT, LRR and PYD domains-containing protein 3-like [Mixophyes fleayi]|uniref:NACHT, LRR and PYD domains-containing protein 3-like n=1 Tax=Mixophyes fleayi TaxID=3061075 RepID=UPI003F4DE753
MAERRIVTEEDIEQFRLQLSEYEWHEIRMLYEYFKSDLVYLVKCLGRLTVLSEMHSQNIQFNTCYSSIEKTLGPVFSEILIQDIMDMGKDAVVGLFQSLHVLQRDHPLPNLLGVLGEICHIGHGLVGQILLDENGHHLHPDLKKIQDWHKQNLLGKTQNLIENNAPGTVQTPQSFNISERYLDLIVVSSQQFRNRSQHEVLETGGKHEHYLQKAQNRLELITPNKLFRWCHRSSSVPHSVIVGGVPGVGKTTLMQKFVFDWVNGKLYQRFAFIFFFKFRDLNILKEVSLESIILKEYPYLGSQLGNILEDPAKLLFIFDGLDESIHTMDFKTTQLSSNAKSIQKVGLIVVSLVRQSLLSGCSVLITSRPTKLASIDIGVFKRVSEIMGFFPKERQMYFDNFFETKELSEKAFCHVRQNDTLYTFCYIPSYCWIICTVLSKCFKEQPTNNDQKLLLPKTVTQLFVTFIANILSNHNQDKCGARELMKSIGWMAEHGVMNHLLTFQARHMETFHVDTSLHLLSSFLTESLQSSDVNFTFFHLTIQEFVAALVHFLDYKPERMQKSLDQAGTFTDGRAEIFLRFLSGLSDDSTRSLLMPYLGELSTQASKHVISWLSRLTPLVMKQERDHDDKRKALNIFAYLFETRNKKLVAEFFGSSKEFEFSEYHLTPLDCTVLSFVLEACGEIESLDLDTCFIQHEGLEKLAPVLHNIEDLSLTQNDLKDEDMQIIYCVLVNNTCRIKKLSLRNNSLTERSCMLLACALSSNESSGKQVLQELDLSRNNLAGKHFCDLMTALSSKTCRITHLLLQQVKLTDEYSSLLVTLSNNRNLTHLNLGLNYFTDAGARHIRDLILKSTSLKEIRVDLNEFSKETEDNFKRLEAHKTGLQVITG